MRKRIKNVAAIIKVLKKYLTIKIKLILSFAIAIVLIIILGFASYQKASKSIINNYKESTSQTLNMTGDYLAFGLDAVQNEATQLISDTNVINYFSDMYGSDTTKIGNAKQTITKLLSSKMVTNSFIKNIYLLSDSMEYISTKKVSDNGIYSGFLNTDNGKLLSQNKMSVAWSGSDKYLDDKLKTDATGYAMRFIRNMTSSNGLVVIDINSDTVSSILKSIKMDSSGILAIVTVDGKEIKVKDSDTVFPKQKFYQEALKSNTPNGSKYVDYKGGNYLFLYSKISKTGAMICALIPNKTISKQADTIRLFTSVIVIVACIIALLNAFAIIRGINQSIKSITIGLKKASSGDLTVKFHSRNKDEFGILSDEIQNTFTNMKNLILGVKTLSTEVLDSSKKVDETAVSFKHSTKNITYAVTEVEQGITQQAKDAEECLSEMDNLSKKIIMISDNTKEINEIMVETRDSITEGTDCTIKLNEQTQSTIQITTDIINKVEQQAELSLSIGKISNVISEIANQINLLALNASIESARAGDYGKGFAVIANEIRNLAEQSSNSVNDIKKIINNIQEKTNDTVKTVHKAEDVLLLQESAVSDTTNSYHVINLNVEKLATNLKQITDTINNIEESRIGTLGGIESISAVLEEIAASANTVNQSSGEQLLSVDTLNSSSEALHENADKLLQAVQRFTV